MAYVYVLRSELDHKLYIGLTADLDRRIKEHNSGRVAATRMRRPLKLAYVERFEQHGEAAKREQFLKSGAGRVFLRTKL